MTKPTYDFTNAKITKIMAPDGRRLGARVTTHDGRDVYLDATGLARISGQVMSNAKMSVDGRILADDPTKMREITMPETAFDRLMRGESASAPTNSNSTANAPTSAAPGGAGAAAAQAAQGKVHNLLREQGILHAATETRLVSIVCAGLEMLRQVGVQSEITQIREEMDCRKDSPYIKVTATIPAVAKKYVPSVDFGVRLNGDAELTIFDEPDLTQRTVLCRSAADIRNAILWLCADAGCSEDIMAEYKKNQKPADTLMHPEPTKRHFARISLPHVEVKPAMRENIRGLEQLRRMLEADRFSREYIFSWAGISDTEAVLSVAKRATKSAPETDSLLDLRFHIVHAPPIPSVYPASPPSHSPVRLKPQPSGYALRLSHRIHADSLIQGSGRWVSLKEFSLLRYLDEAADAVEATLKAVFASGAIRRSRDVLACEATTVGRIYYLRGEASPVTEVELLNLATEGVVVTGINLQLASDGAIGLATPGFDRYGSPIPYVIEIEKDRLIGLHFGFQDRLKDVWVELSAAIPLAYYSQLQDMERTPSAALPPPKSYLQEMLIQSDIQNWVFKTIGRKLAKAAVDHGYDKLSDDAKAVFLLSFMRRCFHYTPLAYTLKGNKSPVEVLVDKNGSCVELALLGVPFAQALGFDASVIFRYDPKLETDFHAVLGVKYKTPATGAIAVEAKAFCSDFATDKQYLTIAGYTGIELSESVQALPGVVGIWGRERNDAAVRPGVDGITSQVVIVPMEDGLSIGAPLAQAGSGTIPLTDAHWSIIAGWLASEGEII